MGVMIWLAERFFGLCIIVALMGAVVKEYFVQCTAALAVVSVIAGLISKVSGATTTAACLWGLGIGAGVMVVVCAVAAISVVRKPF
jgi:hypothetical protein